MNVNKVIEENSLDFWLCQPLSSEIFGIPSETPQNSKTIIDPINNYGLAKTIEFYGSQILRSKGIKVLRVHIGDLVEGKWLFKPAILCDILYYIEFLSNLRCTKIREKSVIASEICLLSV